MFCCPAGYGEENRRRKPAGRPCASWSISASDKLKDKYISELSGGQQQRVSIARALINKPKLIFADEPTGNLDRESGHAVLDLMAELNRENNITMVIVTHDREVALRADYIYELVDGRICKYLDVAKLGRSATSDAIEARTCRIEEPQL